MALEGHTSSLTPHPHRVAPTVVPAHTPPGPRSKGHVMTSYTKGDDSHDRRLPPRVWLGEVLTETDLSYRTEFN